MKNTLSEYYPKDTDSLKKMWGEAVFAFDASVLLNLYKYSQATSVKLLGLLESLSDSIWIPYQAAYEYQKNRSGVILEERQIVRKAETALQEAKKSILKVFADREGGWFLDSAVEPIKTAVAEAFADLGERVKALEEELEAFPQPEGADTVRDSLDRLFDGKVGHPWSAAELIVAYEDAERRIEYRVPPGYGDVEKPRPQRYGDVIVWKQMLQVAKEKEQPIIFVTGEKKDDWWAKRDTKLLGPRPELIREMRDEAGMEFHMYRVLEFIKHAEAFTQASVGVEAVREVEAVQKAEDSVERKRRRSHATLLGQAAIAEGLLRQFRNSPVNIALQQSEAFRSPLARFWEDFAPSNVGLAQAALEKIMPLDTNALGLAKLTEAFREGFADGYLRGLDGYHGLPVEGEDNDESAEGDLEASAEGECDQEQPDSEDKPQAAPDVPDDDAEPGE